MLFAATRMNLEIIMLSKVSQKKKDKYHMIPLICGIQNMAQANLSTKQKRTHRHGEQTWGCQRERVWGKDGLGVWDQQMQTITYKLDKQQGPTDQYRELYS